MYDLIIREGRVIDPLNHIDEVMDVAVENGRIAEVAPSITNASKSELNAKGKIVMPGIIDMHTHMRTLFGHPHAQRMIALAGVTTTLDMAGPLEDILDSIPGSGAGVNIAILQAAQEGVTISTSRPSESEQKSFIEEVLDHGAIGVKLLGGHYPMDLDISASFIEKASMLNAWIGWHVGNTRHGSNIEGLKDALAAANGHFLHVAHVNSYCRGQVRNELDEALEAVKLLKSNPQVFSESYLSALNGTRLTIENDHPVSKVTETCLKKVGCTPDFEGMKKAILAGRVGVLCDDGRIGKLINGEEGFNYWLSHKTVTSGSFAVNPAISRFILAQAKRDNGSFVVDSFSTDGGTYPRNVIVENGLCLVQFGAITLNEFVVKASLNGARALGLPTKGHLGKGADADISILDYERKKAYATIVSGEVIMQDGALFGKGTTIICDERGDKYLKGRGIRTYVKKPLDLKIIESRFIP